MEWKLIFTICFELIKDNDLIWLQYRIIHKILGTKSLLYKMSKTESHLCRNCGLAEETIEHLFFYCIKVQQFLTNFYRWIYSLTGIPCQFTIQDVLLGIIQPINQSETFNILLLLLKDYIFESAKRGSILNMTAFSQKIHQIYLEQEFLATVNSQLPKFRKKWAMLKNVI